MANNYCQFSVELPAIYDNEKEWWRKVLSFNRQDSLDENDEPITDSNEARIFASVVQDEYKEGYSFQWEIEGMCIWFYAEEYGDPYEVACLVHYFLKEMRPNGDDKFILSWAETCSKMRVDEFAGGTVIATKDGVGICGSQSQIKCAEQSIQPV